MGHYTWYVRQDVLSGTWNLPPGVMLAEVRTPFSRGIRVRNSPKSTESFITMSGDETLESQGSPWICPWAISAHRLTPRVS